MMVAVVVMMVAVAISSSGRTILIYGSFQSAADARELSKSAKLLRLCTRRVAT
jgi:hypothetical protein